MSTAHPIIGSYRITHMDQWDQDFVDAEVPGYIRFDPDSSGEFQFGYVHGWMNCEATERDGKPAIEWSWEGNDEMDRAKGRGWAVLQDNGMLEGKLSFYEGDSSGFTAEQKAENGKKEKSSSMTQAVEAPSEKYVVIEADQLRPGPIQHASLPEPLLMRIRAIHQVVKGPMGVTLEQFELCFMRDIDPESEVAIWERIVVRMQRVEQAMPDLDPRLVLMTLLGHSMGTLTEIDPVVGKIIGIAVGK